ncbi:MAG: peptidase, partial [Leptolyngbyaceae cyanobacterium SL_7_1]|nr:peptidase [Leptolyngbyaceae cyanobacterium SL_7_1]
MKLRFCLLFAVAIATVLLTGTTGFASPTNSPSPSPTAQVSPAPTFPLPANLTAPTVEP